jgi:hypothetical protein
MVRQHHAVRGQRGMEEEQHRRDHPRHQKAEKHPRIPRLATDGFAGMCDDGRASLVRPIRDISSEQLDPLSFNMRPDRKERISGAGALGTPFLGFGPLGGHGAARGKERGSTGGGRRRKKMKERCVGSKQTKAAAQKPL